MAKREKRRRFRKTQAQRRLLKREQISITGETNYIINRAKNNDTRIVTLGSLVLFSTEAGDAWMLDPTDGLALCLARDGEEQLFTIIETPTNFSIEWDANYRIDGDQFIVVKKSSQISAVFGYPTKDILRATRQVR